MKPSLNTLCVRGISILFLTIATACDPDIKGTVAFMNLDAAWNKFRQNYHHNVQSVVIEQFVDDNSLVAIIAEPPINFDTTVFNDFMDDYNAYIEKRVLSVGVNGWVRDIVMAVEGLDEGEIKKFTSSLNSLIYDTDYKSYYLPLTATMKPASYLNVDQNLKISAAELKQWFIDDHEKFISNDQTVTSFDQLLAEGKTGVFESEKAGFVAWILPRNGDISLQKQEMRKFALDSDLLLGAIATTNHLAILGREREINVIDLPPLRTETIQLLASANKEQLSQSYERNNFFAGKLNGGRDWAPIYLSDELIDTEYGSLLNITDQMLKSWSENGSVNYSNFSYTLPDYWAFDLGAFADMETNELTYNWNTKGAVYAVQFDDYDVVALNRIGSLPVSYIPRVEPGKENSALLHAEAKAYNFFSNLNNPLLIRANQYAALYQIFSAYGISSHLDYSGTYFPSAPCRPNTSVISTEITSIFHTMLAEDSMQLEERIEASVKRDSVFLEGSFMTEEEKETYLYSTYLILFSSLPKVDTLRDALANVQDALGEEGLTKLSGYVAEPRGSALSLYTEDDKIVYSWAMYVMDMKDILLKLYYPDSRAVFERFIEPSYCDDGWIKTPTAVLSWQRDSLFLTGGHNIDARIVPFKIDKTLRPGKFRIDEVNGVRTVAVAETDVSKITSGFLRSVEDSPIKGIQAFRTDGIATAVRSRAEVIPSAVRAERGFNSSHLEITKLDFGYRVGDKSVNNCKDLIDELVSYSRSAEMGDGPLNVTFKRFNVDEAEVIVKSGDLKLATTGKLKPGNVFQVTSHKYDFSNMMIREMENSIEVAIPSRTQNLAGFGGGSTASVRISIVNLIGNMKAKVMRIIENLKSTFSREKIPGSNEFYKELQRELKNAGVPEHDILIERQDCIICQLNSESPNLIGDASWIKAA